VSSRTIEDEPRWITAETLVVLHAQQVERYGGSHGVLDKNVVLSALHRPINRWLYDESVDFAELAGVYLVAFAGTQGFNDGNKRTGLACALVFLGLNEFSFDVPPQELYELTLAVANHQVSDSAVGVWFRERIKA
jgi:death-on-curing protein